MKRFFLVLMLVVSVLVASVPADTQAAELTQFTGGIAYARFYETDPSDPSGCTGSTAFLNLVKGTSGPGKGEPIALINYHLMKDNFCTGEEFVYSTGEIRVDPNTVEFDSKLNMASVNTSVEVYDKVSGASYPVSFNMRWTGTGGILYYRSHQQDNKADLLINYTGRMMIRHAEASGSIMTPWGNFSPEPDMHAELRWVSNATLKLTR